MVMLLFFRMYLRRDEDQDEAQRRLQSTDVIMDHETGQTNEKSTVTKSRNWPLICLTTVRTFQLVFFAFVHLAFLGLIDNAEIWLEDPQDRATFAANAPWTRMLSSVNLIYHISALVLIFLWRKTEAKRWRYFAITTSFGDLLSLWAFLHSLSLMYGTYQVYCYVYPRVFNYEKDGFLTYLGKGLPPALYVELHQVRYFICAFLDVYYWFSLIPSLSQVLSILMTVWYYKRAKAIESCEFGTFQKVGDLEQAITAHHEHVEPSAPTSSRSSTPPLSPPPSYRSRSGSTATSGRPPSYRRVSMETTSTVDPDTFLVSDGWRGPDQQPPLYSSRPPSLRKELD